MILTPFLGLFVFICKVEGAKVACLIFSAVVVVLLWIMVGTYLIQQ